MRRGAFSFCPCAFACGFSMWERMGWSESLWWPRVWPAYLPARVCGPWGLQRCRGRAGSPLPVGRGSGRVVWVSRRVRLACGVGARQALATRMLFAVTLILVGLVLLYFGGNALVKGAAALATSAGLTPLVVGLTVVAYGTSMPEMVVSVAAALNGNSGLAIGNVVGSNICNVGVVLGLAALCRPLDVKLTTVRVHAPLMVVAAVGVTFFLVDGELNRLEAGVLFLGLILYTALSLIQARREATPELEQEFTEVAPRGRLREVMRDFGIVVFGTVLLVAGGHVMVEGAVSLAQRLGISDTVIGLTVVAFGTSVPDLAASVMAAWHRHGDIAIGNVIGSVMFNLLNVLGITGLVRPLDASGMDRMDYWVMLGMLALTIPLLRTGFRVGRWEGAFCFIAYLAYILWRWPS